LTEGTVKNRKALIRKGRDEVERKARRDLLDIVEDTLSAVDPRELVKGAVQLDGDTLRVGGESIDLGEIESIYVAGGGKACFPMARAVDEMLGDRVTGGVMNVPEEPGTGLDERYIFHIAGHPRPDEGGLAGARQIVRMAERAGPRDLFIMLISGGGSAILPYPAGEIPLSDLQELTDQLLACGATINEINSIRKHVSQIKGGRLAQAAFPARVLSLIVSDVVGDPVESIASGPTSPDPSTFSECLDILRSHGIYDKVPDSIRERLEDGASGTVSETPKPGDPIFNKTSNVVVGNNRVALEAARRKAEELGYRCLVLTDRMEGEAREVGILAASILNSINASDLPMPPPCLVLLGGETTVTLIGPGDGGRNQELALAASRKLAGRGLLLSLATDGRDGPTDSAGALVDRRTCEEVELLGMSPEKAIADNAEYEVLKGMEGHLFTGYTGTNVCDILYILVP
jgi:glycerate 2-kinase